MRILIIFPYGGMLRPQKGAESRVYNIARTLSIKNEIIILESNKYNNESYGKSDEFVKNLYFSNNYRLKNTRFGIIFMDFNPSPYLDRASLVVVPMISGTGIKNKILEAMAMKKSVISTSIGARVLDVTSKKNIVIADHPKEFTNRIVGLSNNEQLRRKIAQNGRRFVEVNYSWEKMADKLNEIFIKICK